MTQKLKITLKKSTIGSQKGQIATVKGLGLKKLNSSVIRDATPETLGMIKKIKQKLKAIWNSIVSKFWQD